MKRHFTLSILLAVMMWMNPAVGSERTFYRAININGPALTIDGNNWEGSTALNYTIDGGTFCDQGIALTPSTDANRATMIRCSNWSFTGIHFIMNSVPTGTYDVYIYVWEDNSPAIFDISVEGSVVLANHNSGNAGQWNRLGPWRVNISDGTINIDAIPDSPADAVNFSGVEVLSVDTSAPNSPPVANAGSNQTVTDTDDNGSQPVTLDGSASTDDDEIISYIWSENGTQIATGVNPSVSLALGWHQITLTITDDDGATDTDMVSIAVYPPSQGTFYRAINLNGSALTIDGNAWEGSTASNYTINGNTFSNQGITLNPATDANRATMIRSSRWSNTGLQFTMNSVPNGEYDVYLYVWEDSDPQIFDISVEGTVVVSDYNSGDAGQWDKIGPMRANITDGNIVVASSSGSFVNFSGVEVWLVGAGNQPPVANAGPDQTVTDTDDNGTENVTLTSSGSTDSDGTIASYVWSENGSQIATGANPTVSLAVGWHRITLTVTDNEGATGTDVVIVIVNPSFQGVFYRAINLNGAALTIDGNAWEGSTASNYTMDGNTFADQSISLNPSTDANRATMIRSSHWSVTGLNFVMTSVPNGPYNVYLYVWEDNAPATFNISVEGTVVVSGYNSGSAGHWDRIGPLPVNISDGTINVSGSAGEPINFSGVEVWSLNANQSPVANAGNDQTVTDADADGESVTLNGSGSTDPDGSIADYTWYEGGSQIATGASPTVSLAFGWHKIALTVTDNEGATDSDTVIVVVGPASIGTLYRAININGSALTIDGNAWEGSNASNYTINGNPFADQTIPLNPSTDANRATMIRSSHWSNSGLTFVMNSVPNGTYDVYLYVWEDNAPATFDVSVEGTVFADNYYSGNAGQWDKIGPMRVTISDGNITISASSGVFVNFSGVEVRNVGGGGANQSPVADAGSDQTVTDTGANGTESVTLDGSASTDADGTIVSYVWSEGGSQIATGATPSVNFALGTHNITLTVTDNQGATATDVVVITVSAGSGAGAFYRAINLNGPALTIDGHAWEGSTASNYSINGGTFCDQSIPLVPSTDTDRATMIRCSHWSNTGLQFAMNSVPNGQYEVYLYVWEDNETQTFDISVEGTLVQQGYSSGSAGEWERLGPWQVNITDGTINIASSSGSFVNFSGVEVWTAGSGGGNQPPVANAGSDQTVTDSNGNGFENVSLNGSGSTDADGTITTYVWSEGGSPIATGATPAVNFAVGTHTITLTVTDNQGATDTDIVVVTVNPPSGGGTTPAFYRAINLNGPALTIDGHSWEGSNAPNYSINGGTFCDQSIPLVPSTDTDRATMIRCSHWSSTGLQFSMSSVPTGQYDVYLYVWEDNESQTVNILLEGTVVQPNYNSGSAGHWDKLGPWRVNITDGTINIASSSGAFVNFSGVEVWSVPPPAANAGADTEICLGQSTTIGGNPTATNGTAPYTYSWTPSAGLNNPAVANPVATPTTTTNYTVQITDSFGGTSTDAVTVTVNPVPTAAAGADKTILIGQSTAIGGSPTATGGTPSYTYSWAPTTGLNNPAAANPTASPSATTSYIITITDSKGCTANDTVIVTVNTLPVVNAGADAASCLGQSLTLGGNPTATGGVPPYTYSWTPTGSLNNSTIANPTATPTATTSYTVQVTDANGSIVTDAITVTVNPAPTAQAGTDKSLLIGQSATLGGSPTATGGTSPYTYSWTPTTGLNDPSIANPVATPTASTLYIVMVTDSKGCSDKDTVAVTVDAMPIVNAGSDVAICSGQSTTIGGNPTTTGGIPPYTYSWTPTTGLSSSTSANPVASPTATTTYTVHVTDSNGSNVTDAVTVTVNPLPTVNAGADQIICGNQSVVLGGNPTATGGTAPYTYSWTPAIGLNDSALANPTAQPNTTTTYTVAVTDAKGCTVTDVVIVSVNPAVVADAGPDKGATFGQNVTIGGNPTASGGTSPFTYSWTPTTGLNNSTVANPTAQVTTTRTYILQVTDSEGCVDKDTVIVTLNSQLSANAGLDKALCLGNFTGIGGSPTANGGTPPFTYQWIPSTGLDNPTSANPQASPTTTTNYTVEVTDANGINAADLVKVTVNPQPVANAGSDMTISLGQSVQIGGNPTASGGTSPYTYSWLPTTGLNNPNASNPSATPSATTTYIVAVTDAKGCTDTDTMLVVVNPSLQANAGQDDVICSGESVTLGGSPTATGGTPPVTYSWAPTAGLNNPTSANPTATPNATTTYIVTLTDQSGTTDKDTVTVTVFPLLVVNAGADAGITLGQSKQIGGNPTATGGTPPFNYSWTPTTGLDNPTVANPTALITNTTTYAVTVVDANGCTKSDTVKVTVNSMLVADAGPDQTACLGGTIRLGGNPSVNGGTAPYTYNWEPTTGLNDPTSANPIASPTSTTTYLLTVTDAAGFEDGDVVTVTVSSLPAPVANAGSDKFVLTGQSVTIGGNPTATGGTSPYTYQWTPSTGLSSATSANPTATVTATMTYVVAVTDVNGCTDTDTVIVSLNSVLDANAGPDQTICLGQAVTLGDNPAVIGGAPPYTYHWIPSTGLSNPNVANPVATPTVTTNYTLEVTDANGTTDADVVKVTVNPSPTANAGTDKNITAGQSVTIGGSPAATGGTSPYTYSWTPTTGLNIPSAANPTAAPTVTTTYVLQVTDTKGCTDTDTVKVTVPSTNQPPNAVATANPTNGGVSLKVQFTGSGSTDTDGTISTYAWNFGDGGTSSAINPQRIYTAAGSYIARLIVTDNLGAKDTAFVQLQVATCKPLPDAAAYGRITGGDQSHVDKVTYCFQGVAGDMSLTYQVYDIDTNGEAVVRLNGQKILDVQVGPNNDWSPTRTATLPDALVLDGVSNTLEFDNPSNPPNVLLWGVRQVGVSGVTNIPPNAVATGNPTNGNAPLAVQFTGSGSTDNDGTITTFAWNFGDGGTSSTVNPQHTYNTAGSYSARLIVTDNQGAKDTAFVQVQALATDQPPNAVATANPTSGIAPLAVQFTGSGSTVGNGSIAAYAWSFGDGSTASIANPQYTYNAAGIYSARLIVTDNQGAKDTAFVQIQVSGGIVNQPPNAVATASPTSGGVSLKVQFTGSGSTDTDGTISTYAWNFGDGGTSSATNPQRTYTAAGSYIARLIVTDNLGAKDTAFVQIQVATCKPLPDAAAYGRITGGDQSHVDKVTYCFQGVAGDMVLAYQVYDIDTNGEVVIRLNGQKILDVQVGPNNDWSTNRTVTLADALVLNGASNTLEFDNPSNPPNTLLWGVRQVSVSGATNIPPNAVATGNPTSGTAPLAVQFTGSGSTDSDGTITAYAWNFGDGGTSSTANPQRTYSSVGSYNARLIVTDNQGAKDTAFVQIQVGDCISLPDAGAYGRITGGDQSHVDKVTYCFQGTAGDMVLTYQVYDIDTNGEAVIWLNGQKVLDVQIGPNNGWSTNRTVVLTDALVLDGISNTLEFDNPKNPPNTLLWGVRQVSVSPAQVVNQPPNAVATGNPTSGTVPLTVQFTGSGSTDGDGTIATYAWTFGDGGTSSTANPQRTYNTAGSYNARLIVTDNQGAKDTAFVQIQAQAANQPPNAVATANPASGTAPLAVQFTGSGSNDPNGTISSYAWTFGDGGTSSIANPQRTYAAAGNYNARLIVTDNQGANDTAFVAISVSSTGGGQATFRVNCGGPQYTATNGKIFQADQMYAPGGWGFADTSSNDVYLTIATISGTSDQTLYKSQRMKVELTYLFSLPNGTYDVILHLAEVQDNEAGRRVMDISAEGNLVFNDFDIWVAAGGRNIAITRLMSGVTVTDGQLKLDFIRSASTVKRRPAIAAIEVGPAGTLAKPAIAERPKETAASLPEGYALEQNYPNPFNPSTNISFVLPEAGEVRLMIYNSVGQPMRKPLLRHYNAGRHTVRINASNWPSGMYFYEIQVNGFRAQGKMILSR